MRPVCCFPKQISYHGCEEGGESEDSEGENQELAQIDRGRCVCVFPFYPFLTSHIFLGFTFFWTTDYTSIRMC